ncbi:hypothetical protein [Dyadobacter frigoris]|uniref:Uncharacterized protein n=1 Tax=Dyadobacter frigoris TaxID=2576211 RepID=A0A4U6CWZ3_9BACT|nr:hypothetical protein [Dyadobacter frigoris]TKT88856.1 hypothetical protein FDK13_24765 [Dyadobacter frigoris]GLU56046.1 hypothetical protein Dfri01_55070 [Dyadobacter frigoris]
MNAGDVFFVLTLLKVPLILYFFFSEKVLYIPILSKIHMRAVAWQYLTAEVHYVGQWCPRELFGNNHL